MYQERVLAPVGGPDEFELPGSRLRLRGSDCRVDRPFVIALGGAETRADASARPFPMLCANLCGLPVLNGGILHAGAGIVAANPPLAERVRAASAVVVGALGPQRTSNRFYRVHRRRNDRVIGVSKPLKLLFHDLDFGNVHYSGHLHMLLRSAGAERYGIVLDELRRAWSARVSALLSLHAVPTVFLVDRDADTKPPTNLPVTARWVQSVAPDADIVEADFAALARGNVMAHRRLAERLSDVLRARGVQG